MDDEYSRFVYVFTDLILPLVVGYVLHRLHLLHGDLVNRMIKVNVIVFFTLLSLLSFWVMPLEFDLIWVPVFGFMYVLWPGLIGYLFFARHYRSYLNKGAFLVSAMLSNIGTLCGVCAFILYREQGFAYTQIIGTCQNILLVSVCFPLAEYCRKKSAGETAPPGESNFRQMLKLLFSPNQISLVGMAAGLCLNISEVARPEILGDAFPCLVHIAAWIALLPVGYLIDFHRAGFYYNKIGELLFLRFIVVPVSAFFFGRLVFTDAALFNTMLICALAPEAINATLTARLYKLNVDYTVAAFIVTTALFLLLIFPLAWFFIKY